MLVKQEPPERAKSPWLPAWEAWHGGDRSLRLGVSSCLLGEEVRYDGSHARDRFVTDRLGPWVEWVSVCPEAEAGLGIPRPTIRIVEDEGNQRVLAPKTGEDVTPALERQAAERVPQLADIGLDGFVFKKGSPSCGMSRVAAYRTNGHRANTKAVGFFARAVMQAYPNLPVEEDGRLNDNTLRENFIERVFCRNRWRQLLARGLTPGRLVAFHTAHKMLLRAHNEAGYRRLGQLVARAGELEPGDLARQYEHEFMTTLARHARIKSHVNVMQHALGYMKEHLSALEKRELLTAIADFGAGRIPLVVPITLLGLFIRRHEVGYLSGQLYFEPHPRELMLRNHC